MIRKCALDLLARREHTKLELQRKLIAKKFAPEEIMAVIEDLTSKGWQSDERFLTSYVTMRANRGFGPLRIRQELYERGISKDLINSSQIFSQFDWPEILQRTLIKKFDSSSDKLSYQEKAKRMRYLAYKGFEIA